MATPLPDNRAEFFVAEMVDVTSGELVQKGADRVAGVGTDTRAGLEGKVFVALQGARFDAHDWLDQAVAAGARCLIVEKDAPVQASGVAVIRVASTLDALGALARQHRRRWGGKVVAIAGSAGKTTTRTTVSAVLEALRPRRVHTAAGNLNNRIGLPLTLLGVTREHEVCVLEVGTNQLGEVATLASVCEPDLGLLTLVGLEHSEGLGDIDAIEVEEGALLLALGEKGCAVGNGDDPRVRRRVGQSPAGCHLLYGTGEGSDYRIVERVALGDSGVRLRALRPGGVGFVEFECPLLGEPGALAAAAAWTVAEWIADRILDGKALTEALRGVGEAGRLTRVVLANGTLVLDDTYNSNPASMQKSVETAAELARLRGGSLWLVLGEMRELGFASEQAHHSMGEWAVQSGASALFVIGSLAEPAALAAKSGGLSTMFFEEAPSTIEPVSERLGPRDVVLVKASRGVGAERVVFGLIQRHGSSP